MTTSGYRIEKTHLHLAIVIQLTASYNLVIHISRNTDCVRRIIHDCELIFTPFFDLKCCVNDPVTYIEIVKTPS